MGACLPLATLWIKAKSVWLVGSEKRISGFRSCESKQPLAKEILG
jgi:hypothetical protein